MTVPNLNFTFLEPRKFGVSDSSPLYVNSPTFMEVLRVHTDAYANYNISWSVNTNGPCELLLDSCDNSSSLLLTEPEGFTHLMYGREFKLMIRGDGIIPVLVFDREIQAVRLHNPHDIDFFVTKPRTQEPPFDTPLDLLEASCRSVFPRRIVL